MDASALPSAKHTEAKPIQVCGQAVELRVAQVSESTVEIVIAPLDTNGAAHLPSRPDALVSYPCREIWRGRVAQDPVVIPAQSLSVQISAAPVAVSVPNRSGELVQRLAWQGDGSIAFKTEAPVFGLGQGGGGLDRRGMVQSLADGYFAGNDTSRIISPILIGADGWALFLPDLQEVRDHRSTRKAGLLGEFDLCNGQGVYRSHDVPRAQRLFLICADQPSQIMAELNRLTGQAALPPRWALGYMQSHRTLSGWNEILQVARTFREKYLPCDALIYLSEVYCKSGWGNGIAPFAWNTQNFPDPAANLAALHGLGYKVVLHVSRYPTSLHGVNLAKPSEDPAHIGNYWKQHHALHELGVDSWWPDDGEDLVTAGRFARHRLYYEGPLQVRTNERPWSLHRTGAPGVQRFGGWIWSGDPHTTWKALAAHVPAALSHGLSLTPFWGSDAGGFVPKPDLSAELYVRWFQFAAFSPAFRSHGRNWHLRLPWGWNTGDPGPKEGDYVPASEELRNPAVEPICRQYLELRYRLLPYNYTLTHEACATGLPMMRALWLQHPDDPVAVARDDEYLWGRDLLVAPVVEKGMTRRTIYLPRGKWFDWWTGEAHEGGREIIRTVDLATLPLFVRAGAIIPLDPIRQYTAQPVAGPTTLLIHAGANGSFTLYEDDGHTLAYQRGEAVERRFDWDDARRVLRVHAARGHYAGMPGQSDFVVRLRQSDGAVAEKPINKVKPEDTVELSF